MAIWQCELCAHEYNEAEESTKWNDLAEDWICPVCGAEKSEFILKEEAPVESKIYECDICAYPYNESDEEINFDDLPEDWICPVCGAEKKSFSIHVKAVAESKKKTVNPESEGEYLAKWRRPHDEFETDMADIHYIATHGHSVLEPMRTRMPSFNWDEILIKGAQLAKLPVLESQPVNTTTVIGPGATVPMVIESPLIVSHMSFGALSKEAKLALAKGSAKAKTAMCSGEGGIIPESLDSAYKFIFEYVPNKYSVTDEYLSQVDAVEIKIGQSAKPGMGGHLPGHKVTSEIAKIRGFEEGKDIISPAHFPDILTKDDLKSTVNLLRKKTGGKPIGIKIAAGHLEEDIKISLFAGVDFITVDGRAGGTGAALKVVKNATSIPTVFALAKARKVLDAAGATNVSLIITGGLRNSTEFAKALAMGADAIAVASAAMMAVGCQQYRICDSGKCPMGIATQDPVLRARLDVDKSAQRVANYFNVCTHELKDFARLTGNTNVHGLGITDLCTTNSEISNHTTISHT